MKNIVTILLVSILGLTGCNLDYAPENTMVDQTVYKNEKTSEAALLGAYVCLQNFLSGAPQGANHYPSYYSAFMFGDEGTDNLKAQSDNSTALAIETSNYTTNEHEGVLTSVYQNGYNTIDYANNVISGITKYGQYNKEMMAQHIAEARFIRAFAYLQMLQIFGDRALQGNDNGSGLVIRLTPYEGYNPNDVATRATNREVWQQIINDLSENLESLPTTVPEIGKRVRANQAVAKALLSRVYLYKGTYSHNAQELNLAAQYAADVLNTEGYSFAADSTEYSTNLFPLNEENGTEPTSRSNEIIFFEASRLKADLFPSGQYNYYEKKIVYVPETMKEYYEPNDVRGFNAASDKAQDAYLLYKGSSSYYSNLITTKKYSNNSYTDGNNDVLYIRLAEMKLTRAEALVRASETITQEAIDLLNDVHQRAFAESKRPSPYTLSSFSGTDSFLKTVLKERNRELAYENHYRYDIERTNNAIGDVTMGNVEPAKWNAPIPDYEVRISVGKITQNSGYK